MGPGMLAIIGRRTTTGQITVKFKLDGVAAAASTGGWLPGRTTWWALGGTAGSDVSAVSSGYGRFELFMRDVNTNAIMHKSWRMVSGSLAGSWLPSATGWTALGGGAFTDKPAAVLRPGTDGIVDVFARSASDGRLRAITFDAVSRQFSASWRVVGDERTVQGTSPAVCAVGSDGRVDVFALSAARGPRFGIHGWWTPADGWMPQ